MGTDIKPDEWVMDLSHYGMLMRWLRLRNDHIKANELYVGVYPATALAKINEFINVSLRNLNGMAGVW